MCVYIYSIDIIDILYYIYTSHRFRYYMYTYDIYIIYIYIYHTHAMAITGVSLYKKGQTSTDHQPFVGFIL